MGSRRSRRSSSDGELCARSRRVTRRTAASSPPPSTTPSEWRTIVAERDVVLVQPQASATTAGRVQRVGSRHGRALGYRRHDPRHDRRLRLISVQSLDTDADGRVLDRWPRSTQPASAASNGSGRVEQWSRTAAHFSGPADDGHTDGLSIGDGTEIGLFVMHRADVEPSPSTPLVLTGYGGFSISETPSWVVRAAAWCAAGGVFAVAGLRGGHEHGEAWHRAGRREQQAERVRRLPRCRRLAGDTRLTSRNLLAIEGGSNGGLLMGVAITQRPDLAGPCTAPCRCST